MEVFTAIPSAITLVIKIYEIVEADREKKGALKEVQTKIDIVHQVLDRMDPHSVTPQADILEKIVHALQRLFDEVIKVQKMRRFLYLLQAKGCQEKLRDQVDTVQFYLNSLHIAQTNDMSKLLRDDWLRAVRDNTGLTQQLEEERLEAAELRRQVDAKSLGVEHLKKMGLLTDADVQESLGQVEELKQALLLQTEAKSQQEAAYLEQVILLIQREEQTITQQPDQPKIVSLEPETWTTNRAPPAIPRCIISLEPLHDPVILDCHCRPTVSRNSFQEWLQHRTSSSSDDGIINIYEDRPPNCPRCNSRLLSLKVIPNVPLREMIEAVAAADDGLSRPNTVNVINATVPISKTNHMIQDDGNGNNKVIDEEMGSNQVEVVEGAPSSSNERRKEEPSPVVPGPDRKWPCTRKQGLWTGIVIFVVLLIGVVIAVVVLRSGGDDAELITSAPAPTDTTESCTTTLTGGAPGDGFGGAVALSSDGTRLAVGAYDGGFVQVFNRTGDVWTKVGKDLIGAADEYYGVAVALSSNGTRLAIGAKWNNDNGTLAGLVQVFDWTDTTWTDATWTQVGKNLMGSEGDNFGFSVALSSDGSRLAVGAFANDNENGENAGLVRVFDWTSDAWTQVGDDLIGSVADGDFGWCVALSADGTRLAVGAPWTSNSTGLLRAFHWMGTTWTQVGDDLIGDAANDRFGYDVALSSDGTRLAVGADAARKVRVFDLTTGGTWTQVGKDIGSTADVWFGATIALSSNGTRLAIGAPNDDGLVAVFDCESRPWGFEWAQVGNDFQASGATDDFNNGFGSGIALSADGTRLAIGAKGNRVDAGLAQVHILDPTNCS